MVKDHPASLGTISGQYVESQNSFWLSRPESVVLLMNILYSLENGAILAMALTLDYTAKNREEETRFI